VNESKSEAPATHTHGGRLGYGQLLKGNDVGSRTGDFLDSSVRNLVVQSLMGMIKKSFLMCASANHGLTCGAKLKESGPASFCFFFCFSGSPSGRLLIIILIK
jgi:hypothetical protein